MLIIYIVLIALSAFPLALTIWRMRSAAEVKKKGIYTNSIVVHIQTLRGGKGGPIDILTLEYRDRATNLPYKGRATVTHRKYKIGDMMPVVYLPDKPSRYAIDMKTFNWMILIFCIILFLFVLFIVYKLNEMTQLGQV